MKSPIPFLRITALAEAVSFLTLLGVAIPLKYAAGYPAAVQVVGWIHGVLFIVFCWALTQTMLVAGWPLSRGVVVLVAGLLPFGPFVIDRKLLAYDAEFRRGDGF